MHMKKANDDSLEETIRLSKGKNLFERIFDFILTIARISDGEPSRFSYFIELIMRQ